MGFHGITVASDDCIVQRNARRRCTVFARAEGKADKQHAQVCPSFHGNLPTLVRRHQRQKHNDLGKLAGTTVHHCLATVKTLATLTAPFLPFTAERICKQLNLSDDALAWNQALVPLNEAHALGKPEILFKKIDPDEAFSQ